MPVGVLLVLPQPHLLWLSSSVDQPPAGLIEAVRPLPLSVSALRLSLPVCYALARLKLEKTEGVFFRFVSERTSASSFARICGKSTIRDLRHAPPPH